MHVQLDIQMAIAEDEAEPPSTQQMQHWVELALADRTQDAEMTIRIVDESEITELNRQYRKKDGPTNVLSFPFESDIELETPLLGDLVICASVVEKEAKEQHKSLQSHWAHMVIHGTLHLLGYDHMTEVEASVMENKEIDLLKQLGFSNPYEVTTHS
jgi:probable rRNA maturation factor